MQFRNELGGPVSRELHSRILRHYRQGMAAALYELRFNILKARTAADPQWRNAAVRLLPLFLRRPVQRLDWSAGRIAGT